ncbi:hypothetical protein [Billgrantia kenyensis]|jgi:hypothetical protein|uniref:DUF2946 domain-containing protein n=1 Tax=Billgrantia kenyensis TaxID=321266 RepID=A0A7W0AEH6_9GAMM|nr:hypothetical protein [Halomonas kenyensis]MBA2779575.1 hypothetical protein [Halomonas kenyensis]MCG6662287.1 hypothetical protein [Halomonas kenyensis]
MTRLALSNLQHRRTLRLLALLLALLVAMGSLTSHAAMEADPTECVAVAQIQHEASSAEEHHCGTCTAVTPRLQLALSGPDEQSATPGVAFLPYSPLPPQRPPRT